MLKLLIFQMIFQLFDFFFFLLNFELCFLEFFFNLANLFDPISLIFGLGNSRIQGIGNRILNSDQRSILVLLHQPHYFVSTMIYFDFIPFLKKTICWSTASTPNILTLLLILLIIRRYYLLIPFILLRESGIIHDCINE